MGRCSLFMITFGIAEHIQIDTPQSFAVTSMIRKPDAGCNDYARLKQQRLDDCIDQIRGRFGNRSIVAASLLDTLPIPDDDRDMVRMPGLMYA